MTISDEPEGKSSVVVNVNQRGKLSRENEEKSRFVKGQRRSVVKQELSNKSPYMYRSELLLETDTEQLNAGNYSGVPTKDVLNQIRAEERQYEKISDCVIREIYAVKRTLEIIDIAAKPVSGYIQFIGFEPFFVINFCAEQINILRDACRQDDCYLYFDATGLSMKRPMDQPKRLYMYCLVLQTRRHKGGIRVAEMLTNDHTTPSITNFLLRIRHAITTGSLYRAPRKIETDFSFAMIHAACRALNSCSLVNYLTDCWNSITSSTYMSSKCTVLHICAAHMLKIFQNIIAQSTNIKDVRKFWLYVLARLQTSTSLDIASQLVEDLSTISKSKLLSKQATRALKRLNNAIQMQDPIVEEVDEVGKTCTSQETLGEETLRSQSPFYNHFKHIVEYAYVSNTLGDKNPYYIPELAEKILKQYLPFFPLWSGVLLQEPDRNVTEGSNRDTNAVVERHFATIKNEILHKEKNINPAKACRLLYISAKGLAKASLASTKKQRVKDDTQEKEKWQRPGQRNDIKKKKSKYFSSPSNQKFMKVNTEENDEKKQSESEKSSKKSFFQRSNSEKSKQPLLKSNKGQKEQKKEKDCTSSGQSSFDFTDENAMRWGGFDKDYTGISLSNTCTIDNILTALHIIIVSRSDVKQKLSQCKDTAIQLVLEICLNDMQKRKWTMAKVKFVKDLLRKQGSNVDLFGSEFEMAVKHLVSPQRHITQTKCIECSERRSFRHDLIELGLGRSNQNTIQNLLFDWEHGTSSRCPVRCGGNTETIQHFESIPVLLFVLVDLASGADRLIINSLEDPINVVDQQYDLYAATLNRHGHFYLLVRSKSDEPWYCYDGLRNKNRFVKLERFRCRSNETVVHLIYVKSKTN